MRACICLAKVPYAITLSTCPYDPILRYHFFGGFLLGLKTKKAIKKQKAIKSNHAVKRDFIFNFFIAESGLATCLGWQPPSPPLPSPAKHVWWDP